MSRMISVEEQYIQDVLSRPECLESLLAQLAAHRLVDTCGWQFDYDEADGDIVNQEYSIGDRKRIDVLATFGRRRKVLVVEVKKEVANPSEFEQLKGYLDRIKKDQVAIKANDPALGYADLELAFGLLIAPDFLDITREDLQSQSCIHLFRWKVTDIDNAPFITYVIPESLPEVSVIAVPMPTKRSRLLRLIDHSTFLSPDLNEAFEELRYCFLRDHSRSRWVYVNVKSDGIWVHYRGEQIVYLQVRKNSIQCSGVISKSINAQSWAIDREDCREKINEALANRDAILATLASVPDDLPDVASSPS